MPGACDVRDTSINDLYSHVRANTRPRASVRAHCHRTRDIVHIHTATVAFNSFERIDEAPTPSPAPLP